MPDGSDISETAWVRNVSAPDVHVGGIAENLARYAAFRRANETLARADASGRSSSKTKSGSGWSAVRTSRRFSKGDFLWMQYVGK